MNRLKVIIPSAGKGTRLHTDGDTRPKVLHMLCGQTLIEKVLELVDFIPAEDTYIVVGYKGDEVQAKVKEACSDKYHFVTQDKQLGTGHAVMVCEEFFKGFDGDVLVTYGDMPMYHKEDLIKLCEEHDCMGNACTIMTAENPDLPDWGKIARNPDGSFYGIVEAKDCTPEQAKTTELFSGVAVYDSKALFEILPELDTNNAQGEYYLTEVPRLMMAHNMPVEMMMVEDGDCIRGVNTLEELADCERILSARK